MKAELIANGISSEKVRLTPLFPFGVSPTREPPMFRAQTGRILMMGRLTSLKGWYELAAAIPVAEHALGRKLTLVVAGDGPDRNRFEAETKRHGVLAEFLGWLEPARRNAEMATADLIAVPSVWPEPFGLIGIEAGCLGLPAVAFDVGGISDWLRPGFSGETAESGRGSAPQLLGEAIARALADPSHWHHLRLGAWETAKRFSSQAHLEQLLPILRGAAV
jgi:glycosyltransferase involved in cell wall biosynthesis